MAKAGAISAEDNFGVLHLLMVTRKPSVSLKRLLIMHVRQEIEDHRDEMMDHEMRVIEDHRDSPEYFRVLNYRAVQRLVLRQWNCNA